jgi:signal transduction histidine kinase/CheY-like chemotaxis protein
VQVGTSALPIMENRRKDAPVSLYRTVNRLLGEMSVPAATAWILLPLITCAVVAVCITHTLSIALLPNETHSSFYIVILQAMVITAITASPLIFYCLTLIRHLRSSKIKLQEAAAAALAASEAKSAFLANMSHEIRTPLNGVLGMVDALAQEPMTPHQADCVSTIRDSSKSLLTIVNDVLDLAKIEAGKLVIAPIEASFYHVFDSILKLYAPMATEKGIKLYIHLDRSVPERICFDTVRVRQCLSNLLSNAIKFTEKGEIRVSARGERTEAEQLQIIITVEDTGIGIDPELLDKLFADFNQADNTTSRRFDGTGLGLSIARRLARLMGGDVTAASVDGLGSTFTLTFASSSAPQPPSAREAGAGVNWVGAATLMSGARMLLADDNMMNRKVIQMLLKPAKIEIIEAENGWEALQALEKEHFDLVLLDVHMPVMDGMEAMRRIRASAAAWRDVAVIALTADVMEATRSRLEALGVDGIAHKPIDQRSLATEILRVLSRKPPRAIPLTAARELVKAQPAAI